MLTAITAPMTQNLMDPEVVLARLKLAEGELADLTDTVAEASGIVARYLRFQPAYGTWRETFSGVSGDRLYLGARPAWSVESVTYRDGAAQASDSYRLERGPNGESAVMIPRWTWPERPDSPLIVGPGLSISGTGPIVPDWTVDFTAGWWLPEMAGTMPAGVETFPRELQADFLRIVRWLRATSGSLGSLSSLGISKTTNEGAMVEFFSAKDQAVDAEGGIPSSCLLSLPLYRRAG